MRKFFFLSLALSLAASTSFAQELNKAEQLQQKDFSKLMTNKFEANVNRLATPVNRVVKRSAADNFYYTIPEGSLFACSDETGNYWKGTMLVVPPFSDGVFTPVCADPSTAKLARMTSLLIQKMEINCHMVLFRIAMILIFTICHN